MSKDIYEQVYSDIIFEIPSGSSCIIASAFNHLDIRAIRDKFNDAINMTHVLYHTLNGVFAP
jgi:hypothetical protein